MDHSKSWIYLFSKFTHEALLFEALAIFLLIGIYAAVWILHKRKLGTMGNVVPSGLVKVYLNELIGEAHTIRSQLFGMLTDAGIATQTSAGPQLIQLQPVPQNIQATASDPQAASKMIELEKKLIDQTQAMQKIVEEKSKVETELSAAKVAATQSPGGAPSADSEGLKKRIQELESKLAEYSVIEDDLANLKRLQQENTQLKAALEGKGIEVPAAKQAAPAPVASAPAPAPAPTPEPAVTPDPAPEKTAEVEKMAESLASQTEENLKAKPEEKPPQAAPAAPATPAPAAAPAVAASAAPAAPGSPPTETSKNDEDLLAEFERMLNM